MKEIYDPEIYINPLKSKHQPLNAQNSESNNRSRSWTGQVSPVTWMTGKTSRCFVTDTN